ncbi:MAG: hypothetical protein U0228_03280 [Myxococcaceae bacterium]
MRTKIDRARATASKVMGYPERLALFIAALHKNEADKLFAGLAPKLEMRARGCAKELAEWDSARRQARLAHEFGVRPDAPERLKQLVLSATGDLRAAIVAHLPPAVRRHYPQFSAPSAQFSEATRAIAARLVREAMR